jgi:hypothetical protein
LYVRTAAVRIRIPSFHIRIPSAPTVVAYGDLRQMPDHDLLLEYLGQK